MITFAVVKNGLKTYQLFLAFALVGVITTVVSFQTIHLLQENCDESHYCHGVEDEQDEDRDCTRFESTDEDCPICELKLPLLSPVSETSNSVISVDNFDTGSFSYSDPCPDSRAVVNYLRGPPQNS